jgi:hypothetical protein
MYLLIKGRSVRKKVKPLLEKMGVPVKLDRGMADPTVGIRCGVNVEFEERIPRSIMASAPSNARVSCVSLRELFLEKCIYLEDGTRMC